MIRIFFIAITMLGASSVSAQSITTTTDYPTTSAAGTVLTCFAFEKYTSNLGGNVDNTYVGDQSGNVHVSESGEWSLYDIETANHPITSVEDSHLGNEPFIGTSTGIYSYGYPVGSAINDELAHHELLVGLTMETANIKELEEWTEGIWAVTQNNGLLNFGEEELDVHFTMANSPLTTNSIASLGLTSTNHAVIAHGSSVSIYRYKLGDSLPWENHNLATSFCDGIQTQYVYVGSADEIFVTTNMGVFTYDEEDFKKVPEFGNRDYSQIISTPTGEVWAFETGVGFHILKGGAVGFIPTDNVNVPGTIYDIKYDKNTVKFLSDLNHGITSAQYIQGTSDADGDGISFTLDGDDGDSAILAAEEEICDDGLDNDCDGEVDEDCPATPQDPSLLVIGQPHPALGGYIFYLNEQGGGLIVNDQDLVNDEFDNLSMFRWAEPEHLRTATGLEYVNFNDWSVTAAHSDQKIIDAYGEDGHYAALAIRQQLGADWRLPTATEAYYMNLNLNQSDIGHFADGHYWTSSEIVFNGADIAPPNAVAIDMTNGELTVAMAKIQALKVRAVRSF